MKSQAAAESAKLNSEIAQEKKVEQTLQSSLMQTQNDLSVTKQKELQEEQQIKKEEAEIIVTKTQLSESQSIAAKLKQSLQQKTAEFNDL